MNAPKNMRQSMRKSILFWVQLAQIYDILKDLFLVFVSPVENMIYKMLSLSIAKNVSIKQCYNLSRLVKHILSTATCIKYFHMKPYCINILPSCRKCHPQTFIKTSL